MSGTGDSSDDEREKQGDAEGEDQGDDQGEDQGDDVQSEEQEVLAANQSFYSAFDERNAEEMIAVWSEQDPVTCIHPGWHALRTREEVVASWEAILSNPESPVIACKDETVHLMGDVAIVLCIETAVDAGDTTLMATNVFRREDGRWKLCHHQAGPIAGDGEGDDDGNDDGDDSKPDNAPEKMMN